MNAKRFTQCSDGEILQAFMDMERDGSRFQVFHDGHIQTAWDFLNFVRSGVVFGGLVYEGEIPAACFWVSDISGNVAFFHYWVFKAFWGAGVKQAADTAFLYLAKNTHLTGLIGRTPEHLPLAVRALKRNGFNILGTIPEAIRLHDGSVVGALLSFYDLKHLKSDI